MLRMLQTNTAGKLMAAMFAATLLAGIAGWRISARAHAGQTTFRITAYGQACFLIETPGKTRLLLDPLPPKLGYAAAPVSADLVLVSHTHFDHSNVAMAQGAPQVLWGVDQQTNAFRSVQHTFADGSVRNVASWHDAVQGKERGPNSIFVIESGGLRLVHLGDLGHELAPEQVAAIGPVDVLFVPVGGTFTIDQQVARKVVAQLAPRRVVIPMHYATPALKMKLPIAPLKDFLRGWRSPVQRNEGPTLSLDAAAPAKGMDVVVLDPGA